GRDTGPTAAEDERGADHHRIPDGVGGVQRLVHGAGVDRLGGFETGGFHRLLEQTPVLGTTNGVDAGADQFHVVPLERAPFHQLEGGVERGLTPEGGQQRVGTFERDDRLHHFGGDR